MESRRDSGIAEHERPAETPSAEGDLAAFVYAVSHDLKEPLFGIETYATCLLEDYGDHLGESGRGLLTSLLGLAGQQRRMIDAVHAYSTLGHATLFLEPIDMDALVADVLESLAAENTLRGADVRVRTALPSVHGDLTLIERVWRALIVNAATFNDKSERWIDVGCIRPDAHGAPAFYVRDNGTGIGERELRTLFTMFPRIDRRPSAARGVGAGLAIARRIIERHHGRIWAESRVGEGSIFWFTLGEQTAP